jgi:hypothetical protein
MQQIPLIDLFKSALQVWATNSPILSGTSRLYVQLWYNAPILLPAGDKVEIEFHLIVVGCLKRLDCHTFI